MFFFYISCVPKHCEQLSYTVYAAVKFMISLSFSIAKLKTAKGNRLPDNPDNSGCISDPEIGVSCSLAGKYGTPFN